MSSAGQQQISRKTKSRAIKIIVASCVLVASVERFTSKENRVSSFFYPRTWGLSHVSGDVFQPKQANARWLREEDESQQQRSLLTLGIPGEGLLLFVANSDLDAEEPEQSDFPAGIAEADYPDAFGPDFNDGHKALHPLDRWDYATAFLATLGLMIAAAGGIGGGGILVPLYILVLRFSPKHAVPLSNITIFGGAITNAFLNMRKRHPVADRPLVDWDLILVMEPLTIGGALVGSFVQKVLPEFLLTVMMIFLLVATADRTLRKGIKSFRKESAQRKEEKALAKLNSIGGGGGSTIMDRRLTGKSGSLKGEALLGGAAKALLTYGAADAVENGHATPVAAYDGESHFSPAVLAVELQENGTVATPIQGAENNSSSGVPTAVSSPEYGRANADGETAPILPITTPNSPITSDPEASDDDCTTLKDVLNQETDTNYTKVGIMTAVFAVVLFINILKGGGGFESPLGIKCGSFSFWAVTVLSFLWVMSVSFRVRRHLVNRWKLKSKLGYSYAEGDVEWCPLNTLRYPGICFFAGFFAGMFGVGGGIVKGPLMLEMGVHPMVASSTSAVMILYTSFTATTSFLVFGLLRMDYAVPLFVIGLVATALGQWGTDYLVQKFKRPSFIILSIGSVVALSAILMGYNGVLDLVSPSEGGDGESGGLCSAGV